MAPDDDEGARSGADGEGRPLSEHDSQEALLDALVGVSADATSSGEIDEIRRRQAQLVEAQALMRVGSWEFDLSSGEQSWSEETYRIVGRDLSTFVPTFEALLECVHPDDRQRFADEAAKAMRPGSEGSLALEHRIIRPDGAERICRSRGRVFFDPDGAPLRMLGAVQDVTGQGAAAARLARILESAHEAFVTMDAAGLISEWNRAAEETFGWSRAEAMGRVLADVIIPPAFRDPHWAGLRRLIVTGEGVVLDKRLELRALHRDGHEFPVELTVSGMVVDGRWEFHSFLRDITDAKRAGAKRDALIRKLDALARTDEQTGLANRRAWEEELPRELARTTREGGHLCVAMLDLDAFKEYNDAHGHQAGDELLRTLAHSWQAVLRPTDVLARYGGEEFAIAFPAWPLAAALQVVERLRSAVPAGQTCSAGLAGWDGEETAVTLVGRADRALYEAKRAGRDRTVIQGGPAPSGTS